ncbi:asparagine synthase (glutamine-hydrolyzing) [Aquirufa rosea]|uniref:asparagine synthase (glutamine-hydrolyzing) n=1 Tax=Aquirufa rosea TaxID=2509241 RepID=A0A4Q1BYS6_9BACT|nr:asparagine synthase (glutamine-hydrolyzing) [Aquirufa rosea]RXK48267.1 asparagine synthase (glutamine-hydrolyzing) [Aquirufa rosea]
MCGIIGAIGFSDIFKNNSALKLISHRGPDSFGSYFQNNVFLGHTRLSIQDLSENGNQPMYSSDERYVIIFNGEIYNHQEIRAEFLNEFEFKSSGDTETVLYGYIKYGVHILKKLNGIFAFAIFDTELNEIIIVRDQFGVKPLYYYIDKEVFLFGSEIKSFLPFNINKEISAQSLFNYLTFLWSPGESTPFKGVKKLLPGTYLKFNISLLIDIKPIHYFQLQNEPLIIKSHNEEEYINKLEQYLLNAVKRQMLSDVPIGFFLSGGLDSSLLVAMARKLNPDMEIICFTVDLGQNSGEIEGFTDDLLYAKKVADYLKVDLKVVKSEIDIISMFDKMIWHLDEPQADAAPLNVLKIASIARDKNIKVLIGGAAGDDLFSGYRRHQALNYEFFFQLVPNFIFRIIKYFANKLPSNLPLFRRVKKLTLNIDLTPLRRQLGYFAWLPENTVTSLFTQEWKKKVEGYDPFNYFYSLQKDLFCDTSELDRMLYWELKTFLVDHNLNYTDKLGMAAGVEARVPYLDLDLVAFSRTLPTSLKMKGKETKYILKKVAERYLPRDVIYRPKTGFGAPVRKWIINDLQEIINERLSHEKLRERGIFDADKVWQLILDNKNGKIDASYSIWALLAIESWFIQFVDEKSFVK